MVQADTGETRHHGARLSGGTLRRIGIQLFDKGHLANAELMLQMAYEKSRAEGNTELLVRTTMDLARAMFSRSPRRAIALLQEIEAIEKPPRTEAMVQNLFGSHYYELQEFGTAERYYRRALDALPARDRSDPIVEAFIHSNRANSLFESGCRQKADDLQNRALALMSDGEADYKQGILLCNMGVHATYRQDYDVAYRLLDSARMYADLYYNVRLGALIDMARGELDLATGDAVRAAEAFSRAQQKGRTAALPAIQARALVWRTILETRGQDDDLPDQLEATARDLGERDLCSDSGHMWLIAAVRAERFGDECQPLYARARDLFGAEAEPGYLRDHYTRMMQVATTTARKRTQPLASFVTESSRVIETKRALGRLVDTDIRILIEGESGTGKTLLARLVHESGGRRRAPFIVVDCTNLHESLFESKLFGHLRGSFTGAVSDSVGLVEQADGGTLFLDEVGEMPVEIQARLLYTIEERRFRPVGSRVERESDFRVIAATNRDLDEMLEDGTLRRDLYHRLAGYRVALPPLRERREDIHPLTELHLENLAARHGRRKTLRLELWEALLRYDWPGNVRELHTVLSRGYHLSEGRRIGLEDVGGVGEEGEPPDLSWDAVRRDHLLRVLRLCSGNVTRASRLLGMNRTTLIYKLKLLGIERPDFDPRFDEELEESRTVRRVAEPD